MVSSGVREVIRYLVEHRLVHVIVTSAGAVEEDIMKTLRPHYVGSFELPGPQLRMRGINRLGNLLVPNLNYVAFEDWFAPLLDELHDEQEKEGTTCTPSMLVDRMGRRVKDASSIWHWAHVHGIPVFCPGITDGAIGDMLYFHLWKRAGFVLDVARDVRRINDISVKVCARGAPGRRGVVVLCRRAACHYVREPATLPHPAPRASPPTRPLPEGEEVGHGHPGRLDAQAPHVQRELDAQRR